MGAGRKTQTFILNDSVPSSPNKALNAGNFRNLRRSELGGVIFGCKDNTMKECLTKQLFGLPGQHFSYVKNIDPGLPLFLFNYSGRKLHGIFEAASPGQMQMDPHAWTSDGSERTPYPAQVQIRVRLQCQPLPESQFKPILSDNYYTYNHFCFELDHVQAGKLISKLSSLAFAPSNTPQNTEKWISISQDLRANDKLEENKSFEPQDLENNSSKSLDTDEKLDRDISLCPNGSNQQREAPSDNQAVLEEKDDIYMKLRELALQHECSAVPTNGHVEESTNALLSTTDLTISQLSIQEVQPLGEEKNEETSYDSTRYPSIVVQLLQGMEEMKAFREEQIHKMSSLEQMLADAEEEIKLLRNRCLMLESSNPSFTQADKVVVESDVVHLDHESIFVAGGYDGVSWLSSFDAYSPSRDVLKSLKPMNSIRAYASVAKLNGELYVFGGGTGSLWYNTVESYKPAENKWTVRPSLNERKGSLAGATLKDKIFAIGGGNGIECLSEVEMFDPQVGRWIPTRSMCQKRFALAAAELNGALYAVGGYDGNDYLETVERFDPREHSWEKIQSMSTKRGCHALVALSGKLYALGGYDGSAMVPSVEIYDPRLGTWMTGDPMSHSRGYLTAAVLKDSIYVIGGVQSDEEIVGKIECYKEGQGWQIPNLKALGRRCFSAAIVLEDD